MITQLLNTAISERHDHIAANEVIWSKEKSFGLIAKLKDSDLCVHTQTIVYYLHGQKWTRKSMRGELCEDEQSESSSQTSSSDFIGESEGWWPSSSAALHFIWSGTSTWKDTRAEWEWKWVCRRWARYLTCNLLIKKRPRVCLLRERTREGMVENSCLSESDQGQIQQANSSEGKQRWRRTHRRSNRVGGKKWWQERQ